MYQRLHLLLTRGSYILSIPTPPKCIFFLECEFTSMWMSNPGSCRAIPGIKSSQKSTPERTPVTHAARSLSISRTAPWSQFSISVLVQCRIPQNCFSLQAQMGRQIHLSFRASILPLFISQRLTHAVPRLTRIIVHIFYCRSCLLTVALVLQLHQTQRVSQWLPSQFCVTTAPGPINNYVQAHKLRSLFPIPFKPHFFTCKTLIKKKKKSKPLFETSQSEVIWRLRAKSYQSSKTLTEMSWSSWMQHREVLYYGLLRWKWVPFPTDSFF